MEFPPGNRSDTSESNLYSPKISPKVGQFPPRFVITPKVIIIFFLLLAGTIYTTTLTNGFLYSMALLAILGTHEFGHYWACRRNNVNASLPNFLPAPPFFMIGTFGAFIMIKEPIPNRRALIEIGASGPIAGFAVAIPVLIIGLINSKVSAVPVADPNLGISFGSSLILIAFTKLTLGVNAMATDMTIHLHPVAYAGWVGMFFTGLNLLPIGQLDGGHITYSLFGKRHKLIAKIFFLLFIPLGIYCWGWYVWALLILLMGLRHPPLMEESISLSEGHKKIGYLSIIIFILTFVPIPIGFPLLDFLKVIGLL